MLNYFCRIKDYLLIKRSGLFDTEFYCLQYPDIRRADVNPLWHFISIGWKERRNPSTLFDTNYYLNANKDIHEAGINPLTHYIRFGKEEGRRPIQLLTGNITTISVDNSFREKNLKKFFSYLQTTYPDIKNIKYIFFLPLFSTGGAELVAMNFIRLILSQENNQSVLMVITDTNKKDINFPLPRNFVSVNLDNDFHIHDWEEKKSFVFDIIASIKPYIIHNINSSVFWSLLPEKGEQIRKYSKIFANIFCFQFDDQGNRTGYAEYFLRASLPYLNGLISDNRRFLDELKVLYNLQSLSEKLYLVYTPLSDFFSTAIGIPEDNKPFNNNPEPMHGQLQCLWAGRLDEEKRYNLFLELVSKCDLCNFDMYGQAVVGTKPFIPNLKNLSFHGSFSSFDEIFERKVYDAFIFTSKWEGLPTTLISVGSWGVPIVAPNVGGIGELVNPDTGYLLESNPTSEDYIAALKKIHDYPDQVKIKTNNMRKLIAQRHNWTEFTTCVSLIPGYLNESE